MSTASNIPDEFGSNAIANYFQIKHQVASCGPEMVWKIFDAVGSKDGKPYSVFLFAKSYADKLHKPKRREVVSAMLKRDIRLLTQLRHPGLLRVCHPIEETSETLAFATERVWASLANVLGDHNRMSHPIPADLRNYKLTDFQRKHGIFQINEVLRFLHSSQAVFHNNLCPSAILLTHRGQWRLGSLAFLESSSPVSSSGVNSAERQSIKRQIPLDLGPSPWTRKLPKMARPDPHFSAPECLSLTRQTWSCQNLVPNNSATGQATNSSVPNRPGTWSDMFSLGLLICALYAKDQSAATNSLIQSSSSNIKTRLDSSSGEDNGGSEITSSSSDFQLAESITSNSQVPEAFRRAASKMPLELIEPVEKMLSRSPSLRPSSHLFALLKYFNDPCLLSVDYLTNLEVKSTTTASTTSDRISWFRNFISTELDSLPKDFTHSILTPLLITKLRDSDHQRRHSGNKDGPHHDDQLVWSQIDELVIDALTHIIDRASSTDYDRALNERLLEAIRYLSTVKTKSLFLANIEAFSKHASSNVIEQQMAPMVLQCLGTTTSGEIKIRAMDSLKEMAAYLSDNDLEGPVLRSVKASLCKTRPYDKVSMSALQCLSFLCTRISPEVCKNELLQPIVDLANSSALTRNRRLSKAVTESIDESMVSARHQHARIDDTSLSDSVFTDSDPGSDDSNPIFVICGIWKSIIATRGSILTPQLVAREIFPSLLPHVLNKCLQLNQFRFLMSTLYALLDFIDAPSRQQAASQDSIEGQTQYKLIPALTVSNAPSLCLDASSSPKNRRASKDLTNDVDGSGEPVKQPDTFVPMFHPNQLRERQNSTHHVRRASAHVICPLPLHEISKSNKHHHHYQQQTAQSSTTGQQQPISFLGIQLPNLRRHSYDSPRESNENLASSQLPQIQIGHHNTVSFKHGPNSSSESMSRHNSDQSLVNKVKRASITSDLYGPMSRSPHRDSLQYDEDVGSRLLTAQVCEGPFISAPLSRSSSRRLLGSTNGGRDYLLDFGSTAPAPSSPVTGKSQTSGGQRLTSELGAIASARRASFNALSDTVLVDAGPWGDLIESLV